MTDQPYLIAMTAELADRLTATPAADADRIAAALRSRQSDGGFIGRAGGADLYYTAFGLRALALLDALTDADRAVAGAFCRA
ncbi:MAG: beta-hydroxylase, partial [Gemmatimonadota bacterium]